VVLSIQARIRHARTRDDVSIAFWTLGDGPPVFVSSPFVFCHAGLEGRIPLLEQTYRRIGAGRMVVRWDIRNYGKSQRGIERIRPQDYAADVFAVADALGIERFDFVGLGHHPTVAAMSADRVRRMVLVTPPVPRLAELLDNPDQAAVRSLAASNWRVFTETHGSFLQGWQPDAGIDLARFIRDSVDQADYLRIMDGWRDWDVTPLLARIECPTLIVTSARSDLVPKYVAEGWNTYASEIPNATLVEVERDPQFGSAVLDVTTAFLDEEEDTTGAPDSARGRGAAERAHMTHGVDSSRFRTVLFTDIVNHTEMMTRLGDAAGRAVLRDHERITRDALNNSGGNEIKTMGDGFLASFDSVTRAVECAVALQSSFAARNATSAQTPLEPIEIRIGINAGEPVQEEGDLFGSTVILAARIAAVADAGEILVPAAVRHLLAGKDFHFDDREEATLKGFDDPIRLYAVDWSR
jgi:class 3 adenylate cyclase/pimeloyl-ACP methyl ester carboxylesterase